jgi:Spx/MgsR family transcriptional regulator
MPKVEFYGYSSCSSCRSAEVLLARLGIETIKRDLFREPLTAREILALFERTRLTPTMVLSRRSRPYVTLGLSERNLTDGGIILLMSDYPALIRRPIVVLTENVVIGYNPAAIEALVG